MHGHARRHAPHRSVKVAACSASHGVAELVAPSYPATAAPDGIVSEVVCEVVLLLLVSGALIHSCEVPLLLLLLLHLHELLLLLGAESGPREALVPHEPLLAVHLAHLATVPVGSPVTSILLVVEGRVHAGVAAVHGGASVGELSLPHHLLLLEVHHLVAHRTHWL